MDAVIRRTLDHLAVSNGLFKAALKDLSYEELHRRAAGPTSSMLWIAGHITMARVMMLRLAGEEMPVEWSELFSRGARIEKPHLYPKIESIIEAWDRATDLLKSRLPELSEDQLDAASPREFPVPDRSLRGALAFLSYHEAYHIGQMGLLRKVLGYPGLVG